MSSSDGDILFAKALGTCARSGTPRDGGAALGVFCDWLEEQIGEAPWIAVIDAECSGFIFVAIKEGSQYSCVLLTAESAYPFRVKVKDFATNFKKWFSEAVHDMWTG